MANVPITGNIGDAAPDAKSGSPKALTGPPKGARAKRGKLKAKAVKEMPEVSGDDGT